MAALVYGMCAVTACVCAVLLLRAYKKLNYKLLLWSGLCFGLLSANNVVLVVDKLILPDVDLSLIRNATSLIAMLVLLYGLIWEAE